jgi:thiamine biosynthesis lipoprotein
MMSRARPLLGTMVSIQVLSTSNDRSVLKAMDASFDIMEHVGRVMSAHDPFSDLGRMSRAQHGQVLTLDEHTITVLKAACDWTRRSRGAFHPFKAATSLIRQGLRPGLANDATNSLGLNAIEILSRTQVRLTSAVAMDFGGIAKGYAVDQAIRVLAEHGITQAMVNAGGDIGVLGDKAFAVKVRHACEHLRDRSLNGVPSLRSGGVATSVAKPGETGFVKTISGRGLIWRNATVMAKDCMTADVLTKWGLQSSKLCPELNSVLRQHHAKMWRS